MESVRVRQAISHVIMEIDGVKPSPLPAKVFTERYPAVKYPYSVVKHKAYSHFGLAVEAEVALALKRVYKDKFRGDVEMTTSVERFPYLSEKDQKTYIPLLVEYIAEVVSYFTTWYPPSSISHLVYQDVVTLVGPQNPKISLGGTQQILEKIPLLGHPDVVVWLDDTNVVIYDIKVFARTSVGLNKEIRLQICSYAALARSMGLMCNHVGVIMPWARTGAPVRDFDITKWKEASLQQALTNAIPKVIDAPFHYLKWSLLLLDHSVGSHIHLHTAINISHEKGPPVKIPFQIFLYGNNPSATMEANGKAEMAKLAPDFSRNNIFVHAPYNITLCSPAPYIVETIKTYLRDAYELGCKGVVFHTGHHSVIHGDHRDEEEGLEIMKRNIEVVLDFIHPETPLIIETPCGNNHEMLNTPETFADFLMLYPEHLVGACIDTCHVFVSGTKPTDYIRALDGSEVLLAEKTSSSHLGASGDVSKIEINPISPRALDRVCLIHFNGSRKRLGCCADGHAHVTTINNIPDEELEGVLMMAAAFGIPCVTE
jgi:endonuclease IV